MSDVEGLLNDALSLMAAHGYTIEEKVFIAVDKELGIMGYTTEKDEKPLIVVSEWSLNSGMVMGLLIHELSHVYRTQTLHPSHNFRLHEKVLQKVLKGKRLTHKQRELLHNTINNIQDLYADDVSFSVYITSSQPHINEFFLGWIHDPISPAKTSEDLWTNAGNLLNAAFANANLERHHAPDTGEKIELATGDFLEKSAPRLAKKFNYFTSIMVHLPEEISDEQFEKFLAEYLKQFLQLTIPESAS